LLAFFWKTSLIHRPSVLADCIREIACSSPRQATEILQVVRRAWLATERARICIGSWLPFKSGMMIASALLTLASFASARLSASLLYVFQSHPMPFSGYLIKDVKKEHTYSDLSIEINQRFTY
jgi:hypothetical protein